jgi:hypothetical protein
MSDSRERYQERIVDAAARLRARHVHPPDPFAWTHHEESTWWAIGNLGRSTVSTVERSGWAVGDYPWEVAVHRDRETLAGEVFVKPTFVDAEGRIVPIDTTRPALEVPSLLTDEMLAEIAATMERIAGDGTEAGAGPETGGGTESGE